MSPSSSGREALRSHVRQTQRLLSCVSHAVVVPARAVEPKSDWDLSFGSAGAAVTINTRGPRLRVRFGQRVQVFEPAVNASMAGVTHYRYGVSSDSDAEILAFHLHPGKVSVAAPHLHVSSGAGTLIAELQRAHIPTGVVTLAAFVRFLVVDFGARPLRPEWEAVLRVGPAT